MAISNNKTSLLVNSQVPEFVRNDHSQFVKFLEKYYEFMEQELGAINVAKNFNDNLNIDFANPDFEKKLYDNFLEAIPQNLIADKKLLLKHIKDFYRSRGSEKSLRFLLNILTPKIFVPQSQNVNILKLQTTLFNGVTNNNINVLQQYTGRQITGVSSGAIGKVERIVRTIESGTQFDKLTVVSINGDFIAGENVYCRYAQGVGFNTIESKLFSDGVLQWPNMYIEGQGEYTADREPQVYYPKRDILRASDGKWYVEKTLRVHNTNVNNTSNSLFSTLEKFKNTVVRGNTTNSTAIIERVNRFFEGGTQVDELVISSIKGEFQNGENVFGFFTENDITYYISTDIFNGALNTVTITNPGSKYNVGDVVVVESATGTNANVIVSKVSAGNIKSVVVAYSGAGFHINDFIQFSSVHGYGANAVVSVVNSNGLYHPNSYNVISSTIDQESDTPINSSVYANLSLFVSDPANNYIQNVMSSFVYSNTGPVQTILVNQPGQGYLPPISPDIFANTRVRALGTLGRVEIVDGGELYQIGEKIYFNNVPGGYGFGARANITNVDFYGAITGYKFESVDGYEQPGGAGYDMLNLPLAVPNSVYGFGAELRVTAVLGDGEELIIANSSIGGIEQLTILDRGSGYDIPPTLNLSSIGDGTAQATSTIIEGVYRYPGRYLNDDGMLSESNYLQNKDYYHNYSYVVKAKESLVNYENQLKDTVHPAGMITLGEVMTEDAGEIQSSDVEVYSVDISTFTQAVGIIDNVYITVAGSLYNVGDPVILTSNGSGANAVAVVGEVISGNVNNITVGFGGAGFQVNNYITFTNTNAIARVFSVDKSGVKHPNTYNLYTTQITVESNTAIGNSIYSNVSAVSDPANSWFQNVMPVFVYANTGPVTAIAVLQSGNNTNVVPTLDINSNTVARHTGIIGHLEIVKGGTGYQVGEIITFTNIPGGYGYGANAYVSNVAANGMITAVTLSSMNNERIGGAGYDMSYLPKANVITTAGSNANIVVRATIGDGEILNISNTSLGGILRVTVTNRGDGYVDPPIVDLTDSGDGLAEGYATIITDIAQIEDTP